MKQYAKENNQWNWENCEINVFNVLISTKHLIAVESVRSRRD